jgi:hypothetical protein
MALVANDMVEVKVNGICEGQRITNIFHYWVYVFGAGDTLLQFLTQFRTEWRANILPLISNDYSILTYEGKILSNVNRIVTADYPESARPMKYRIRYRDQLALNGVPADDDGGDAGDNLPSFVAVGVRKVLGGGLRIPAAFGGGTSSGKLIKGSCRLGPINEDLTEPLAGNDLTPATITAFGTAMEVIRVYNFGGGSTAGMCVPSFIQDGNLWNFVALPGAPVYTWVFSTVESFTVNPKITSQVSRKERV